MNQYIYLLVFVVAVVGYWIFIKASGSGGERISPRDAKQRLETEKGVILLDVRTEEEYLEKHIPASLLIPVDSLAAEASRRLPDKNAEIIVYCRSGSRSSFAVRILSNLGYTHVSNLGGIDRWPYETVSGKKSYTNIEEHKYEKRLER